MKKTKTDIRVVTWYLGTLIERDAKVVEALSRQQVDICGVQEYSFKGTRVCTFTGRDCKLKFFFCAQAAMLLAENWDDKVIEVQCISDRITLLKLIIGKAVFIFLSVNAPQVNLKWNVSTTTWNMQLSRSQPLIYFPSWWLEWSRWCSWNSP